MTKKYFLVKNEENSCNNIYKVPICLCSLTYLADNKLAFAIAHPALRASHPRGCQEPGFMSSIFYIGQLRSF